LQYLKPFSVSNYAQKLINELDKTEANLEIKLNELALHVNHYSTTHNDSRSTTVAYYIDPRIMVGFCLQNRLEIHS
jgi:hypothetical protein